MNSVVPFNREPAPYLSQSAIEAMGHYVFALFDARNGEIFYVGKGSGNSILDHAKEAIASKSDNVELSEKLETLRNIHNNSLPVDYYILRHNLTEREALLVESAIIDLLTYTPLKLNTAMTNIQSGHHQWDEGIRTFDEICAIYDCEKIKPIEGEQLLLVNLNRTYKSGSTSLYDCARGNWKLAQKKAEKVDYILGVYKGIVRVVIKVEKCEKILEGKDAGRFIFEGEEILDSPYLNTNVSDYPFGSGGAITYIPSTKSNKKKNA